MKKKYDFLNKFYYVKVILICFVCSMILTSCKPESSHGTIKKTEEISIELSMEEAIDMGFQEASKYYNDLKLTEIHSYDNDDSPSINTGIDGSREWWYVDFANEKSNYVSVLIHNANVIEIKNFDENWNNGLINLSDIKLTAEEAVQKAREIGLCGGDPNNEEEWIRGYNFKLSYASLIKTPDDMKIFLEVIGISPQGNFAHVDFDAATGEILLAEEKIVDKDGNIEWRNFIGETQCEERD